VPDYDAFGRPIGEDPLAALRDATKPEVPRPVAKPAEPAAPDPVASAAPDPVAPAALAEPVAPAPRPVFVRRRRRRGRGVVVLLFIAAAIGGVALAAIPAIEGVSDDISGRLDDLVPPTPPPALEGESLILRANFADAIATLRGADLGRPIAMRVAPDRIDATLLGDRVQQVQVTFDGELKRFSTSTGAVGAPTIAFDRIDPSAPERLVRRGAERAGAAPAEIDYLVLGPGPGLPWGAYFKGGGIVQGDARGRPRRVVSEQPARR
jgi:hypothetical protein